jgi:immune inhibitor A
MQHSFQRVLNVLVVVVMVLAMGGSANMAAPRDEAAPGLSLTQPVVAKKAPIAISAIPTTATHLKAPRVEKVEEWLRADGVIAPGAPPERVQAALNAYYARFAKKSSDWVSPEIQAWALKREAELATPSADALAIQPITATILAMAVDFGATETFILPVDDGDGGCITQTVTITGPLKGQVPHPGPNDNFTVWYSPTLTNNAKFYEKLMFGYEGAGRTRYDMIDPDDGQPGIQLAGTMQDYYDNVAGTGNVYITGTVEGWVTVLHSEGYYGAPGCASGNSDGGASVPVGQLVVDALKVFSTTHSTYYTDTSVGAFWKKYDGDHNGVVDQFALVHAGIGQEADGGEEGAFAIWSHSSSLFASGYLDGFKVYEGDPTTTTDDIYVLGYTMQPESLDLGVLVEEFGHNFFGWPDMYTSDADNSVGFWNTMAGGSWLGWLGGTAPAGMPLWFRMIAACGEDANGPIPCNWQEPMVTRAYTDTQANITIGQLEKTPAGVNKGIRINMPSASETINNEAGTGKAAYTDQGLDNANLTLDRQVYIPSSVTGTLSISSSWYIEGGYDYGFVIVNGAILKDTTGYMSQYGTMGWWGLTGRGSGVLKFDLSAYKGTTVTLRLNYRTDTGYTDPGWWVDDVKLDGQLIDNFEAATAPYTFPGWTNSGPGWTVAPLTRTLEKYYLVEWRAKTKYDQMVKTAYQFVSTEDGNHVDRIPHNLPGALVYYRDQGYKGTYALGPNLYAPPSIGPKYQLLIVDTHPEPMRFGVFNGTVYRLSRRAASYDAALTLQPTARITVTVPDTSWYPFTTTVVLPSKEGVTKFSDAQGYYAGYYAGSPCPTGSVCFANTESSAVVPARGKYSVKITHYDGTPYPEMYGTTVGSGVFTLGSGNPGDASVQHGVNIQLVSKAGDDAYNSTATLSINNASVDILPTVDQAAITAPGPYTVTYQTVLKNTGTEIAYAPSFTYTLDSALTMVSMVIDGSSGTVVLPGGTIDLLTKSWRANSMWPGSMVTVTLVAIGTAALPSQVTTLLNAFDGTAMRGPLYLRTDIQVGPDLRVTKSGPPTAKQGDVITYTLTFSNAGNMPAYNVWMTDTLPAGVVPLTGVVTTMFVPVVPVTTTVLVYPLPVRVTTQGVTLTNRVDLTTISPQLNPTVGKSATWKTVVAKVYKIYLPIIKRD